MILDKYVQIKISSRTYSIYHDKGYDVHMSEIIDINIEDLSLGSNIRVNVECDVCKIKKTISYCDHYKYNNEKKYDSSYYCSKCKNTKTKKTNLRLYGVENVFQSEEIKHKIVETNLSKYGVEYPLQNKNIQEKQKQTNLSRYGVEYQMQLDINKEKSKATCLNKYGVEFNMQNLDIFEKQLLSGLKIKKYKDSDLYYQGTFEKDFLDKYYSIYDILRGETVRYKYGEEERVYYPDFFLPEFNLIIEIKSTKWFNEHYEKNKLKEKACIINGFNFIFIIDKSYNGFEKLLYRLKEENYE